MTTRGLRLTRLLLLLASAVPVIAAAQPRGNGGGDSTTRPEDRIRPQFEPSYIVTSLSGDYHGQDSSRLLLEANVAPPFYLAHWSHNAIVGTPKIVLRQFTGDSWPVRPPNFMPRITYYRWWVGQGDVSYVSAMISHYSNGQSGPHRNPDGTLNHADGNFSTWFVEGAYQHTRSAAGFTGSVRLSIEWQLPFAYDHDELRDYSKVRPAAEVDLRDRSAGLSATVRTRLLLGDAGQTFTGFRRFTGEGTLAWAIPGSEIGLFLDGYFGQDFYNNNYDQYREILRIGIATNQGSRNRGARAPGAI